MNVYNNNMYKYNSEIELGKILKCTKKIRMSFLIGKKDYKHNLDTFEGDPDNSQDIDKSIQSLINKD